MTFIDTILAHYGWQGVALAGVMLTALCVQLYYFLFVYGRIPSYRIGRRPARLREAPPVSVVIPMFSEDNAFVEQTLPRIVAQEYPDFEVVIVYVGSDADFYEDLVRLRHAFPCVTVTKIQLDPRFPISPKMALNVGIKSAHNEHLVLTTTDAYPLSDRGLSRMAKGFMRAEVVVGYCGLEPARGIGNYLMRAWRMMHAADWLASAVKGRPYRGIRHNLGFTKTLYFGANGFTHLNMNIGEDDLFMQKIMTPANVGVVLSPRAALCEKTWGGLGWWTRTVRFFDAAKPYYPRWVRTYVGWEMGSRLLFWLAVACALAVMPWEYKIGAGALLLVRYGVIVWQVRRIARRLGERRMCGRYFLYDLLSPFYALLLGVLNLRKDERVWR